MNNVHVTYVVCTNECSEHLSVTQCLHDRSDLSDRQPLIEAGDGRCNVNGMEEHRPLMLVATNDVIGIGKYSANCGKGRGVRRKRCGDDVQCAGHCYCFVHLMVHPMAFVNEGSGDVPARRLSTAASTNLCSTPAGSFGSSSMEPMYCTMYLALTLLMTKT